MAEDKREQDLVAVNDCEWVRALDSNGNSIKIRKLELIELIRKEMPIATPINNGLLGKDGFFFRGTIRIEGGWNDLATGTSDIVNPGMYQLAMGNDEWSILVVFYASDAHGGVVQFAYRWTYQSILFRISGDGRKFTTGFKEIR